MKYRVGDRVKMKRKAIKWHLGNFSDWHCIGGSNTPMEERRYDNSSLSDLKVWMGLLLGAKTHAVVIDIAQQTKSDPAVKVAIKNKFGLIMTYFALDEFSIVKKAPVSK